MTCNHQTDAFITTRDKEPFLTMLTKWLRRATLASWIVMIVSLAWGLGAVYA